MRRIHILKHVFMGGGLAILVAGVISFILPNYPAHANNERIITIYHDGQQQIVASNAETVGEVLERAKIPLNKYDAVEPAKDTKLVAANYNVNVYRARPITVVDGTLRYRIMTPYQSAKKIAQAAGLQAYDEDIFNLDRIDNFIAEDGVGLKLTIVRSTPLNLVLYGKPTSARTQAKTVGELLKEKKITLGTDDGVSPAAETPIVAGMAVAVYRNGVQVVNEEQPVQFETKQIQDADQEVGYKQVQTPGVLGKKLVTYQVELRDGKEVSRKEIQSVVTLQSKQQVEVVGTKRKSMGSLEESFAKLRQCEAGGNYARNSGNGYYGAYQYDVSTWAGYGGYRVASDAPPAVQDQKAYETYQRRGWSPWPACSRKLGLQ